MFVFVLDVIVVVSVLSVFIFARLSFLFANISILTCFFQLAKVLDRQFFVFLVAPRTSETIRHLKIVVKCISNATCNGLQYNTALATSGAINQTLAYRNSSMQSQDFEFPIDLHLLVVVVPDCNLLERQNEIHVRYTNRNGKLY